MGGRRVPLGTRSATTPRMMVRLRPVRHQVGFSSMTLLFTVAWILQADEESLLIGLCIPPMDCALFYVSLSVGVLLPGPCPRESYDKDGWSLHVGLCSTRNRSMRHLFVPAVVVLRPLLNIAWCPTSSCRHLDLSSRSNVVSSRS